MGRNRHDLDSVTRVVNKVIDGNPARRDEAAGSGLGGRYARHGKPCCLVGEVLVALGASIGTLKELDKENEQISDSRHPFWRRFDPVTREFLSAMQRKNDGGEQWGRIKWELFRIDPYWVKVNPKFAYPGSWCTNENGHVAEWGEAPKF